MDNKKAQQANAMLSYANHTHSLPEDHDKIQAQRLLSYLLKHGSITTIETRQKLNIMHPAGRIMNLRQQGYLIIMERVHVYAAGVQHRRVARYILITKHVIQRDLWQ